ncbi:putative nucleolar complex protein 14 [Wickerhamiella sorbophila]|uniref:Putative nucleolar complex protein 14 n=1 Tax=Wickerhamiella sorbophila TaxID=45607 RepID=A0A2T0FI81_9ASCO|nr:putative nucleolar complex protein 14 [Wickerhamiella sorbophila]PRT54704.1 putative nucleolar complex protein 14 [Wickerhamiella sorbophila]
MAGSILKKLKNDLQRHDLLRHQGGKKSKSGNGRDRKDRDRKVLDSIREAFNPFDTKKNREKFQALGQNVTGQQGKPGISKQIGEDQRKQTYEALKRVKNRVGAVVDRRFGENDKNMSSEDVMVERYARERMARVSKASRFNLDDDDDGDNEILTHYGQALSMDDDFAEGDLGLEDDELPSSSKKRKLDEGLGVPMPDASAEPHKKSKHEVMQEIIQKSKLHRAARQQEKEHQEDVVDELNSQDAFDSLMADLRQFEKSNNPTQQDVSEINAAYDQAVREMAFDRRAQPGNRTKTEEELRKEAAEKRANLEKMRQQRMEGEGDDLDIGGVGNDAELFGLELESDGSEEDVEFSDESDAETKQRDLQATTKCPQTTAELKRAISAGGGNDVATIKEILKQVDPARAAGNKKLIEKFTVVLCQYTCQSKETAAFKDLVLILKELVPKYSTVVGDHFRKAVDEVHQKVQSNKPLNGADMLMFSLVPVFFSTSDQWHIVSNGATLVLAQHLSKTMAMDTQSIAVGLYFCDLLLAYQRISKRFIPEIPAFLLKTLSAVDGVEPAAKHVRGPRTSTIKLGSSFAKVKPEGLKLTQLRHLTGDQLVVSLVGVIDRASTLWRSLEAYAELFEPLSKMLHHLAENAYIKEVSGRLDKTIKFAIQDKRPLQLQELRPMAIVTQAPLFEDNFNPEVKSYNMNPELREAQKLKAILKKERKQTLKEIRRDAEFLGREKLKESRDSMNEYHKMLASLTNKINSEEGAERNRYEREKRKRRR